MSREKCDAAVEVLIGHYCEEGERLECGLDKGHDNPDNAIGSRPVVPFHKYEEADTYPDANDPDARIGQGRRVKGRLVITWETP